VRDIVYVDTAGGDFGGNENLFLAFSKEAIERSLAS